MLACTIVAGFVLLVNLFGYFVARRDKHAARQAGYGQKVERTPERLFYLIAMLGGWPGTALAFKRYRHKTRKVRFLVPFWALALLGTVALVGWLLVLGCTELAALAP